jgi:DNA (cytosine-5)-methyltransferase 1
VPKSLVAFDMFAGCGGLSLGLKQAGIDVLWANDFDNDAATTYRQAHPNTIFFQESAEELYTRMVTGESKLPRPMEVDLLSGGPPCQGFSGYNRHRHPKDPRNSLVEIFLNFVEYLQPRYVLMENVPGLLSLNNGGTAKLLLRVLKDIGYVSRLGVLQAGYYGVPQNRWRVFVLAARQGEKLPGFPLPTHEFPRKTLFGAKEFRECIVNAPANVPNLFWSPLKMATVYDAISDIPAIKNGGGEKEMPYVSPAMSDLQKRLRSGSSKLYNHQTVRLGTLMFERCKAVPKRPGAGWLDLPEKLKPRNLLRHGDDRYPNRFGRLNWEGTFNTIVSRPHPYWSSVFHVTQDRVISAREAARAQAFPDIIKFYGSLSSIYRQIGNAVPPLLAEAIGQCILKTR